MQKSVATVGVGEKGFSRKAVPLPPTHLLPSLISDKKIMSAFSFVIP